MKFLSRAALFAAAALLAAGASLGASFGARAEGAKLRPDFAPPWQGGANDDIPMSQRGLDFTEPDADNLAAKSVESPSGRRRSGPDQSRSDSLKMALDCASARKSLPLRASTAREVQQLLATAG